MKKIINFFKTLRILKIYSKYDTRLHEDIVFGRPWVPLRFSARFFPFWFGRYNYNNIILQAKAISVDEDIKISSDGTFNFTRYLEKKLLQKVVKILNLSFSPFSGYRTSGGTEANIYAMWIAREWARTKNKVLKNSKTYWIIANNSHYSINKAINLLDINDNLDNEIIKVGTDSLGSASYEKIIEHIQSIRNKGNDPIILPLTVMTTECGSIDPVRKINSFIIESKIDNIFFHIDAAFSGFLLPFVDEYKDIFSLKSLSSISVDFSKTIGGPVGSGAIIFKAGLEEYVVIDAPYLLGNSDQTLSGSRKGAEVIAMYSLLLVNSDFDIEQDISNAIEKTQFLSREMNAMDFIKLFYKPTLNYIVFYFLSIDKDRENKIRKVLSSYSISSSIVKIENTDKELFKIILRKDHSYKTIKKLINDLKSTY